ncbi:hypothetical protein IWQ60_011941 [Tieghemiomyces parasiticus]|uniref:RRM domain-containing protein n=1 Tax=Tieghemiomyces parasiticus TaxID=78921 RepID=A0A9W7ZM99_9FUNG|nr:hypothetical protein IWQ60_011941 [Tieghemiomyces parasiticus]
MSDPKADTKSAGTAAADKPSTTPPAGDAAGEAAAASVAPLDPSVPAPGKLFVGGLSWETSNESLLKYFEPFGAVVEHMVMRDQYTGRSRGFGFVRFSDPSVLDAVIGQEHFIDGKHVDPKIAIPRDEQPAADHQERSENRNKVFVGHVPVTTTAEQFQDFFTQYGPVTEANLIFDRPTGKCRGFGFVTFEDEAGYLKALNAHDATMEDQLLDIKPVERRHSRHKPQGPGNYSGYYESGQVNAGRGYGGYTRYGRGGGRGRGAGGPRGRGRGAGGNVGEAFWNNPRYRPPGNSLPPHHQQLFTNPAAGYPYGYGFVYGQEYGRPAGAFDPALADPAGYYSRGYLDYGQPAPGGGVAGGMGPGGIPLNPASAGGTSSGSGSGNPPVGGGVASGYPGWPGDGGAAGLMGHHHLHHHPHALGGEGSASLTGHNAAASAGSMGAASGGGQPSFMSEMAPETYAAYYNYRGSEAAGAAPGGSTGSRSQGTATGGSFGGSQLHHHQYYNQHQYQPPQQYGAAGSPGPADGESGTPTTYLTTPAGDSSGNGAGAPGSGNVQRDDPAVLKAGKSMQFPPYA